MIEQRFLYLWFPQLATGRYIQSAASPEQRELWANAPFATTSSDHNGPYLCGLNRPARTKGLRPGMRLSDARAILPALQTQPGDAALDVRLLHKLARLADHFSPWIALDGPHLETGEAGLWLDMSGAVHLFGAETALIEDVHTLYQPHAAPLKTGLADHAWAAWASARFHAHGGCLEPGQSVAQSQDFPLEALGLEPETIQRLNRLGLRTLGDLRAIPRANLVTRFGLDLLNRLDRLCGDAPSGLTYVQNQRLFEQIRFFEEPLGSAEIIQDRVNQMLGELCLSLKEAGLGLRLLGCRFERVDGAKFGFTIQTSLPVQDPQSLMRLVLPKLPGVDAGFGIETLHIRAFKTQWIDANQQDLASDTADQPDPLATHSLMDRIRQRLGASSVFYLSRLANFIPENSVARQFAPQTCANLPDVPARPIRLLDPPEHVDIKSQDGEGLPRHFVWRRQQIDVLQISGPERLTRPWWSRLTHSLWDSELGMRDYYRVHDQAGRDLWLCCSYGASRKARWFIHGWFG